MAGKKSSLFGYTHIKHKQRKRPERHSKKVNKRSTRKKSRGQGQ